MLSWKDRQVNDMSTGMTLAKEEKLAIKDNHKITFRAEEIAAEEILSKCAACFPGTATVFAWQIHTAGWGRWDGKDFRMAAGKDICLDYLQEIRVFDQEAELHLTRNGDKFTGRYLKDEGEDKELMYVDAFARLFGEVAGSQDGFARLKDENRQQEHMVPIEAAGGQHVGLLTRNYIDEVGDMGQLSYVDYRFMALEIAN